MSFSESPVQNALRVFEEAGGTLRTSEALERGIHPRTLYRLRDGGQLEQLSRGLYRLAECPPTAHDDLITVAGRVPEAVISLISALAFHDLTDEVPHEVYVALPRGKRTPQIDHPPLRVFHVRDPAYSTGVDVRRMHGIDVPIYDPAKTVADAFKFRRQIGKSVALDALRRYLNRTDRDLPALVEYAELCRVKRVMTPYMEALV